MRWTKVIAENQSFSANLAKPELLPQFRMLATMISKHLLKSKEDMVIAGTKLGARN
jgi:hypothetical protein